MSECWTVDHSGRDNAHAFVRVRADHSGRLPSRVLQGFWFDLGWFTQGAVPRASQAYGELNPSYTLSNTLRM